MLVRIPDYLTYLCLSQRGASTHGWQRNMFPIGVLVEGVPLKAIEPCEQWILKNQGVMEVNPSRLGDSSQRDLLLLAPLRAFMDESRGSDKIEEILSLVRSVLSGVKREEVVLNCGGKPLRLGKKPRIMGIINVTPDSFSDGGVNYRLEDAVARAHEMVEDGVDIIDVGGESSRPGSDPVEAREEMVRVVPVISRLARELTIPISVDTTKSEVARAALDAGAGMINDISGLHWDLKLAEVAARYEVPVVIMHTRGKPKTMQQDLRYQSLFSEILRYLKEGIEVARAAEISSHQIVVDPGIGFGKSVEQNLMIMNHLYEFSALGKPILLGASRKSFVGKTLDVDVDQRLEGTLATTLFGALRGADIIRVHDVKENRRVLQMLEAMIHPGDRKGEISE